MISFNTKTINLFNGMLLIPIPQNTSLELIQSPLTSDKTFRVQIDIPKQKRSLNANNYCWALCQSIAEASSTAGCIVTREQVYRKNIRELFAPVVKLVPKSDKDFWLEAWSNRGTGWLCELLDYSDNPDFVYLAFWVGSSTFDKAQMSRLIEGLLEDARELGVSTITDAEYDSMIKNWKGGENNA